MHNITSLMQDFQRALSISAANLWLPDSQCEDLAVTGDSAAKAATFTCFLSGFHRGTESQRSSIPAPCSKQSPQTGFLAQCLFGVWTPPRKDYRTLLAACARVWTVKKVLSYISTEFFVFQFVPVSSCPFTGYYSWESNSVICSYVFLLCFMS